MMRMLRSVLCFLFLFIYPVLWVVNSLWDNRYEFVDDYSIMWRYIKRGGDW